MRDLRLTRSDLATLLILAAYVALRVARLCLFVAVVAAPWLLLLVSIRTGNPWLFVSLVGLWTVCLLWLRWCARHAPRMPRWMEQLDEQLKREGR